ncbi:MAG: enoyl-CoA hydratase/isomerase family protein [Rhodospirillales bacterium]|jgi:2-(1,2-epoxy-1,2-dihydrophenyl)acetyl-CoA isomerase
MSSSDPTVTRENDGAIAVLRISNPKRRNAFSPEVRGALVGHMNDIATDDAIRSIVITGAGKTFSAGGDLSTMQDMTAFEGRERIRAGRAMVESIWRSEKPVVAAVEGFAFGAGLSLALLADWIVAAEDASFCASFGRVGLMGDMGLFWTLPQRVSAGRARRILMLAEVVTAQEALKIGLVEEISNNGKALDQAMTKARVMAEAAPLPNRLTREALGQFPATLDDMLAYEAHGQGLLFTSADTKEGLASFFEKRRPVFQGA